MNDNQSHGSQEEPMMTMDTPEKVELTISKTCTDSDSDTDDADHNGNQLPSVEEYKASVGHRSVGGFFKKRRPDPDGSRAVPGRSSDQLLRGTCSSSEDNEGEQGGHLDRLLFSNDSNNFREIEIVEEGLDVDDARTSNKEGHGAKRISVLNPWHWCHSADKRIIACYGILLVILAAFLAITILFTTSMRMEQSSSTDNIPDRFAAVVDFLLEHEISEKIDLARVGSPQYKAAQWIANEDKFPTTIPSGREDIVSNYESFVERYIFALFYFALDGPTSWKYSLNFLSPTHVCTWYQDFSLRVNQENAFETDDFFTMGVHGCKIVGNELVASALYLPNNGLNGYLPNELQHLDRLEVIVLQFNPSIIGPLPPGLRKMTKLRHLALQYCNLAGVVPDWIGDMTSLEYLGLGNNLLSGNVPQSMQYLTNLQVLGLDNNDVVANINLFQSLSHLKSLILQDARISGTLSDDLLAKWPKLIDLDLSQNLMHGPLPNELFFHAEKLRVLDLHGNEFTGFLPTEIPFDYTLQALSLHNNKIASSIPESISNLKSLQHLDISSNQFSGTLPQSMADMTELRYLFTANNEFATGRLPSFVQHLTNLRELGMKHCNLIGQIPEFVQFLTNLKLLDLHLNSLTGSIPEEIGMMSSLEHLLLNNNQLTGSLPDGIVQLSNLELILLDGNSIVGSAAQACESLELKHFVSDCGGDKPELQCDCCDLCCSDDNATTCNSWDWMGNIDPTWEYGFQRGTYTYDQGPEVWVLP